MKQTTISLKMEVEQEAISMDCKAHVLEIAALKAEVQNLQRQLAEAAAAAEMTAPPVPPRLSLPSGSLSLPGQSPSPGPSPSGPPPSRPPPSRPPPSGPPSSGPSPSRPPPPPPPPPPPRPSPQSSNSQPPQLPGVPGPSQLEPFLSPGSTLPTRPKRWQKWGIRHRGRRGGRGGRGTRPVIFNHFYYTRRGGRGTRPVIINHFYYTRWTESEEY